MFVHVSVTASYRISQYYQLTTCYNRRKLFVIQVILKA